MEWGETFMRLESACFAAVTFADHSISPPIPLDFPESKNWATPAPWPVQESPAAAVFRYTQRSRYGKALRTSFRSSITAPHPAEAEMLWLSLKFYAGARAVSFRCGVHDAPSAHKKCVAERPEGPKSKQKSARATLSFRA